MVTDRHTEKQTKPCDLHIKCCYLGLSTISKKILTARPIQQLEEFSRNTKLQRRNLISAIMEESYKFFHDSQQWGSKEYDV